MPSLSQIMAANQPASSGLLAAALRKGVIKTSDLVKPGMYDPNLDFTGQTQGLGFFQQYGVDPTDPSANNPGSAYNVGTAHINEGLSGGSGSYRDPQTGQTLNYTVPGTLAELGNAKSNAHADYLTQTGNVQRGYQNLASSQAGRAEAAGVAHGGALEQALAKRTANQGRDQGALDESWRRYVTGNDLAVNKAIGGAAQGQQTLDTGLGNAQASNTLFKNQLGTAKVASAQGMGNLPDLPTPDMAGGTAGQSQAFGQAGIPSATKTHIGPLGTFVEQPAVGGGVWHIYENGRRVRIK